MIDLKQLADEVMAGVAGDGWSITGPHGLGLVYHMRQPMGSFEANILIRPNGSFDLFGGRIDLNSPLYRNALTAIWAAIDRQTTPTAAVAGQRTTQGGDR